MSEENWTIRIKPQKKAFDVDLRTLWQYRDLYVMYVKRDIITVYKQTILGPLWFLIQPVLTTIMFTFVFGGLAGITTNGIPQPLFYMSGIVLWNYFSTAFTDTSDVFGKNANVFGKVYFPRLIVPLATVSSNLVKTAIQMVLYFSMVAYYWVSGYDVTITWAILLLPVLIFMVAMLAMSSGMIISSLTTKYRDLKQLIAFGVQLFMYATPVIYPLDAAPERYRRIIELNPLSSIFEAFKYATIGSGELQWGLLGYSLVFMALSMFFAVIVFNKVERTFMDTV